MNNDPTLSAPLDLPPRPDAVPLAPQVPTLDELVALARRCFALGDLQEARHTAGTACRIYPNAATAFHALAAVEAVLGHTESAVANEQQALLLDPGLTEADQNLRHLKARWQLVHRTLVRHSAAIRSGGVTALGDQAETYVAIGRDLMAIGEATIAAACFRRAIEQRRNYTEAFVQLGFALDRCDRLSDAVSSFRKAVEVSKTDGTAIGALVRGLQDACLWSELAQTRTHQLAVLATLDGQAAVAAERPFANLTLSEDPAENRASAARYAALLRQRAPILDPARPKTSRRADRSRRRIGYISSDFRYHPVGQLAAPIIAHHDRERFELFGYSIGANDESAERQAAEQGCDMFRDVNGSTDLEIAEAIASDEIDILVDLNGYTRGSRSVVMTLRPAPVQVWMMGFPGTSGSDFVDYIVADRTALPPEHAVHFSEQPCWLPFACQTLDDRQAIATEPVTRAAIGLPEDGPLLVSWQTPFKIEPRVFGLWMDILRAVPEAHLWLRRMPRTTRYNLGQEAVRRGIDPTRIVYADEAAPDKPGYLRSLALADIALDTFIYNGHATTSDFLWAGVPVITLLGRHFAGRVAASLIEAAGLPELITYSDRAYRDLAVKLALDPDRLAALRARLADNRAHAPLFDTARYVRDLERGYDAMWARHLRGEPPAPIAVEATS